MSTFLETLKERMAEAQARLQTAVAKFQVAQQEHQKAAQEFASWQHAVSVETQREQRELPLPVTPKADVVIAAKGNMVTASMMPSNADGDPVQVNKSELVRQTLRRFTHGAKPGEVWGPIKGQVTREYVYSVLKRLKDKKMAYIRRGKYFFVEIPKAEESEDHSAMMVQ